MAKKEKWQPDVATRLTFLICGVIFAAVWTPGVFSSPFWHLFRAPRSPKPPMLGPNRRKRCVDRTPGS
jgi:hypothetical protein